jgi:hypothetical protein
LLTIRPNDRKLQTRIACGRQRCATAASGT